MVIPAPNVSGLADSYERTRPRYPVELFAHAVGLLPADARPTVVDAGAGTGIALEALLPLLPADAEVHAVDVSGEMISLGQEKFPQVTWERGAAEQFLAGRDGVDLVVAALSYQWMDRPAFLASAARALRPGGVCMVVQNDRDYRPGGLPADYEDLLKEISPFYSPGYRGTIDVEGELAAAFDQVERRREVWRQPLPVDEFIRVSSTSTQGQRAIATAGPLYLSRLRALCARHARDGLVHVPHVTEAFYGRARG
ncbi:class I SAM-dependent methyltransferase [Frankia sp. CNm7]|uniref:Class I SAM-dependent methyltransferase n=1 Tax=Frankia nepalensis TaxID=1836974 RepID=A0A937UQ74_9ACTN|nr:class I SAM-dependent methyltransferase [Frankia nepalensis]MBL7501788.1 class I SAM-dependent methyltransferase [Frankia nepalensis]MBL7513884.1 class I SAM-dependent methyltransferase [Frankia nepalensis]MBL7523968.1 class I SAM-dependent methyltransferase [Frankia nepalensis]MBL7626356.1 class I SAM-dependent methyltransferase [Frankia nepalensis]